MAKPSYDDRLRKIIKGPAPQPLDTGPATLGSPSDRGPSQVPPIPKGSELMRKGIKRRQQTDTV